jgi:hypothetical protein
MTIPGIAADPMALLAEEARHHRPRLFAIYGQFNDGLDDPEFLGWGMAFDKLGEALYYDPAGHDTHRDESPVQILRFYQRMADVRLEWLDPE